MALSDVFSYTAFVHAVSGTAGGSAAMTLFYPLDALRTVIQVGKNKNKSTLETIMEMVNEDGIGSFYSGLSAVLVSLGVSNFVYFYANNLLKVLIQKATKEEVTIVQNLFIASLAGVINVFLTCPLWVANTRLRLQSGKASHGHGGNATPKRQYKGLWDAVSSIAREEGPLALWNGTSASLLLVSNPTIHFVVYDKVISIMKQRAAEVGKKGLSSGEIFLAGAIAKSAATIFTYPIQVAQSRLRAMASKKDGSKDEYLNTFDVLLKIFKKDGILGWFAGVNVKVVQTVLTAAFQFLCYEQIKNFIFSVMGPAKHAKLAAGH